MCLTHSSDECYQLATIAFCLQHLTVIHTEIAIHGNVPEFQKWGPDLRLGVRSYPRGFWKWYQWIPG